MKGNREERTLTREQLATIRRAFAIADDALEPEPIVFNAQLCAEFISWSRRNNSKKWARAQERILEWWRVELGETELRELSLARDILPALERAPGARAHRIATLKKLCAWLREERHLLAAADDPTAELLVPQNTPAQWTRSKIVLGEVIEKTSAQLSRRWRDALDVLLGTAWHITELERFVRAGEVLPATPRQRAAGVAAVLCTRHKSRAPHLTAVSARVLAAAERLIATKRRGLSASVFTKRLKAAAKRARVEPWTPGRLRHTVSSFALEQGADDAAVASFLGHADKRTTRRWYTLWVAPAKVPTLA